ncbi:unnamed protein product [Rhodiola kirilowii]
MAATQQQSGNISIPSTFIWPDNEKPSLDVPSLQVPIINLNRILNGDVDSDEVSKTLKLVNEACRKHGFFVIMNHGVEQDLIEIAHKQYDQFFSLPLKEKDKANTKSGEYRGKYSGGFGNRFASKKPWKEDVSFRYCNDLGDDNSIVHNYFVDIMGQDFDNFGRVYQEYCEAMYGVTMKVAELLDKSLGLEKCYTKFFEKMDSIMKLNYYPACPNPELTLGVGQHTDPTSITILHQDNVGGLQVFVNGEWQAISPVADAFIVNLGDTFTALSNGIYSSCLHRVVTNTHTGRKSLTFFVSPLNDTVIKPPEELMLKYKEECKTRHFPDFTWSDFYVFTQKHYRPDTNTFKAFIEWSKQQEKA